MTWLKEKQKRIEHFNKYIFGWRLHRCGACSGTGYYDHTGSPPCGACEGTGKTRYKSARAKLGDMRFYMKNPMKISDVKSWRLAGKLVKIIKVFDARFGDGAVLKVGHSDADNNFTVEWVDLQDVDLNKPWKDD